MKLTAEQVKTLEFLHENDKARYYQHDMTHGQENKDDAIHSINTDSTIALVDETKGIVGYIMEDSMDEIQSMLNLQQYSNENQSKGVTLWEHIDNACGSVWNAIENNTNEQLTNEMEYAFHVLMEIKQKLENN